MKAIRVFAYGTPDVLTLAEVDDPVPGENEVLIDVATAAVNPIDWKIVSGSMQAFIKLALPFTPGVDAAGTVVAVGRNVTTLAPGDEVMGFIGIVGAYASRVVVDAARLARKPAGLSFAQAAAMPAATLTAWQALHEHGALQSGQSVLIHAAAGGVGSAAVQLANLAGAQVIGTASAGNRDYVLELGAAQFIDYRAGDFSQQVPKVDLVIDLVGASTQARSWSVLKPGGTLVSTVSRPDTDHADIPAGATGKHFSTRADGQLLTDLAALYASGGLRTHLDSAFPLAQANRALERSMGGHVRGKVILDMSA